ncbi:YncE family protein [Clostridium sp. OS1-26]|uniref:YncE family protein n=1 Tax=Clostridium sp. OS1-26 TaxID=3070681 RepID=UPI0027DEBE17|nr:YncE family protein [Clostridium sp. OS1-26]WML35869.1 YncE family protein [Clostridium sp. OS1-26]
MKDLLNKIIYYIANYVEGTLSIVDGAKDEIIKKINCGLQPYDVVIGSENRILVANSGSNTISIVCANDSIKTLKMPNNGHIDVDFNMARVYVSNISSVAAYNIEKGNLLWRVDGFYSVKFIKLSNSKNKLFILDDNKVKIYNAKDGSVIGNIMVGNAPSFIEINEDDDIAYISNTMDNSISVIDINNLEVIFTICNVGNAPIGMKLLKNNLYVANSLGNNVTIVNALLNSVISSISVGMGPERITSTPDCEKLLVSNTTENTISIINPLTNMVESTIQGFSQPIGIVAVNSNLDFIPSQAANFTDPYQLSDISEAVCIRENKMFSRCVLRVCFREVKAKTQLNSVYPYIVDEVRFSKGYIVSGSDRRIPLKNNPSFSRISFSSVIPYAFKYHDKSNNLFIVNGVIEDNERNIVLYVPNTRSETELKTIINTRSQLLNAPIFKDGTFIFSVGTFIEVSIVGEVDLLIPALEYCTNPPECEEYKDDSISLCKEIFELKLFLDDFYPKDDCLN